MTKIPTLEEMLKAGMHFGHSTSKWHPKMAPYIFTSRNGVYIIDLRKSQKLLAEALDFLQKISQENKMILFVGTKNQVKASLKKMAIETEMAYVSNKWLGGCMTNFPIIKKSIRRYLELTKQREEGKLDKYTKKERLMIDKEIEKLEIKVGGLKNLNKLPDVLFVWDVKNEKTAVTEAKKKNIPIVAVCDTNSNPDGLNYLIPANDDSTKTIKLILDTIKDAILEAKSKTKTEA